jgi:hypothetical protein
MGKSRKRWKITIEEYETLVGHSLARCPFTEFIKEKIGDYVDWEVRGRYREKIDNTYWKARERLGKTDIDMKILTHIFAQLVIPLKAKGYTRTTIWNKIGKQQIQIEAELLTLLRMLYSYQTLRTVFKTVLDALEEKPKAKRGRKPKREYPLEELKKMQESGMSLRQIAKETGIPKSTIHRLLSQNTK